MAHNYLFPCLSFTIIEERIIGSNLSLNMQHTEWNVNTHLPNARINYSTVQICVSISDFPRMLTGNKR